MLSFEGTAKICDFGLCTGLCMAELQPAKETGPHALPSSPTRHPKNRWSWSRATVTPTAITASPPRKADTARAAAGASGSGSSRAESPISRAGDKARARGTPRGWRTSRPEHSRRPSQSEFSLRLSVSSTGASTGSRAKRPSLPALINSGAWELAFKLNRVGPHYVKAEMTGQTGSSLFMAPENFLRKPYNDKVDIFSFSIIMLEVLARRRAYAGLFLLPGENKMASTPSSSRTRARRSVTSPHSSCPPRLRPAFASTTPPRPQTKLLTQSRTRGSAQRCRPSCLSTCSASCERAGTRTQQRARARAKLSNSSKLSSFARRRSRTSSCRSNAGRLVAVLVAS